MLNTCRVSWEASETKEYAAGNTLSVTSFCPLNTLPAPSLSTTSQRN